VWQLLGRIVNDNAVDYISSKINRLQSSQADLVPLPPAVSVYEGLCVRESLAARSDEGSGLQVWGILQKLAANEEVCVGSKDTTTGYQGRSVAPRC